MKFLQNIPFSLHGVVLVDQIINILTLNFTNICNVFICDCFRKLSSYCGHFAQKFHRCKKRVGLDGSKESNIRRPLLSNLTCFHVLHDVHPRYPQFSWCGRYCHVLTYLNNTMLMHQWFNKLTDLGILNILMLGICHSHDWNLWWQFGESRGTIFCELCGNPVITSIMMCGMM